MGYREFMVHADNECIPISATLELTNKCNQKCIYCYNVEKRARELSTAEFKSAIRQLENLGTLFLTFTGGEVLTRPDFFEIARYARERGFAIRMLTNGTLIDEETADKIAVLQPLSVEISLFSIKPEIHDAVTRTMGSLEKALEAMRLLKKRGIKVLAKSTFMRQNAGDLASIREYCRRKRITFSPSAIITPRNDCSAEPCKYRLKDRQLAEWYASLLAGFTPAAPRSTVLKGLEGLSRLEGKELDIPIMSCYAGRIACNISPYGEFTPCIQLVQMSGGNVRKKKLRDMWNSSKAFREVRRLGEVVLEECTACRLKPYCIICPGMRLLEGSIGRPLPESCRQARMRKLAATRVIASGRRSRHNGKQK